MIYFFRDTESNERKGSASMMVSEKRWLLSVVTAAVLAVTMLFSPATVLAATGDGSETEGPQVDGAPYTFTNSDGQEINDAYRKDGYVFRVVNSDGTEEEPNYVAKVYGDLNAGEKTELDIPAQLGGYPVVSTAMDPRYPVADESYDSITKLNLSANLTWHHYLRFFDNLKTVEVAKENPVYKSGADGVMYWYRGEADDQRVGVELYPRGKGDVKWVMPDDVTRSYGFYEGCPLEKLTIGAGLDDIEALDLKYLTELQAVEVAEGNEFYYAEDGVLFERTEDWGDDSEEMVNVLLYYPKAKKDAAYTVPDGVVKLDGDAFVRNSALEKLTISEDVSQIESEFPGCDNLKTIEFTAKAAPSEENYDYYEGLQFFVSGNEDVKILYPEDGTGYEEFIEWLGAASLDPDTIGYAEVPENPIQIKVNDVKSVKVGTDTDEVFTFVFQPEVSGTYAFLSSSEDESNDPEACVFTENERIAENDDYETDEGYDSNFKVIFHAEKGQTYYLQTKSYVGNIEFKVTLVEAEIEEHAHEFDTPEYTWSKDNSEVTASRECQFPGCVEVEKETVKTTSKVIREATCVEKGATRYTAEFENKAFKKQQKTLSNIPMTAHKLTGTDAKDATYKADGNIAYWTCSECGKIFSDADGNNEISMAETVIPKLVMKAGTTASVGGSSYSVISPKAKTVAFTKAKNVKTVTVPATVKLADGKTYKVTSIKANAFKKSKATKVVVKTKALTKKTVKSSLKGSKVKTVQVKVGSKKVNKQYVKKYKKIFTKKVAGKKVTVK